MKKCIILFLTLTIFSGCKGGGAGSAEPLDVGALTKEYKESKERFKSKYQGKEITASGFVQRPATMISERSGGTIYLAVSGEVKDEIRCLFDTADSAVFLDSSVHAPRTVKGIVDVSGGGDIELKFCKFVSN